MTRENDEVKGPHLVDAMTPGREGRTVVVEAVTSGVGPEAVTYRVEAVGPVKR